MGTLCRMAGHGTMDSNIAAGAAGRRRMPMTRGKVLLITLILLLCTTLCGVSFSYYRYVRDTRVIVQNAIDDPLTVPVMQSTPCLLYTSRCV